MSHQERFLIIMEKDKESMAVETHGIAAEPAAAYGTNTYDTVMYLLHTMPITLEVKKQVAHRLTLEVTGKNLSRTFSQLDHLATLQGSARFRVGETKKLNQWH
jgi:hypothetical protein